MWPLAMIISINMTFTLLNYTGSNEGTRLISRSTQHNIKGILLITKSSSALLRACMLLNPRTYARCQGYDILLINKSSSAISRTYYS